MGRSAPRLAPASGRRGSRCTTHLPLAQGFLCDARTCAHVYVRAGGFPGIYLVATPPNPEKVYVEYVHFLPCFGKKSTPKTLGFSVPQGSWSLLFFRKVQICRFTRRKTANTKYITRENRQKFTFGWVFPVICLVGPQKPAPVGPRRCPEAPEISKPPGERAAFPGPGCLDDVGSASVRRMPRRVVACSPTLGGAISHVVTFFFFSSIGR